MAVQAANEQYKEQQISIEKVKADSVTVDYIQGKTDSIAQLHKTCQHSAVWKVVNDFTGKQQNLIITIKGGSDVKHKENRSNTCYYLLFIIIKLLLVEIIKNEKNRNVPCLQCVLHIPIP